MKKQKKTRVVLVEDEQTLLNLIVRELEKKGYEVESAQDGRTGLALIQKTKPDLVLLDILLPGLDGFDILDSLTKDHILPDLPIIIISNSGQEIELERAKKLGVRDYLIKVNFNPQELMEKIADALAAERKRDRGAGKKSPHRSIKHVLLVEDEEILANTLKKKFTQKGYSTFVAANAAAARSILQENPIDIILLDLVLPDMSGFAFLAELKSNPRLKKIPVVITSNLGQKEEIKQGLEAGALDYIVKTSTNPVEIVKKVESIIKQY
ncbi:MAG: response regulator [bacterium]|nr:response regulator [bacterium]